MICEICRDAGWYGDNGPGINCVTHYACGCIMRRLDRIDAIYQKYKDMDKDLADRELMIELFDDTLLYDLWQAIRRNGKGGDLMPKKTKGKPKKKAEKNA